METPFGSFVMKRWPHRRNEQLRAWDNADLYLLQTLSDDVF
jgi:16S rRNA (guanine1207-N2)-methyltransferase/23S rRNA (guanine1835-N2)-methyltransferase